MKRITTLLLALCQILAVQAAPFRFERSINDNWSFHKDGSDKSETVNIPHSWNAADCNDDEPGFWRGAAWYEKSVVINDELQGRKLYIRFEGAYQELDLYVNGRHAGNHKGGFTAFSFDISEYVAKGANEFRIRLDNSHDENIPPMRADFTFFGGIYRDINLIIVPESHISLSHYGSNGVYVSTPEVGDNLAKARVQTHLDIAPEAKDLSLEQRIIAPGGRQVAAVKTALGKSDEETVCTQDLRIPNPKLWDVDSPQLYTLITRLLDRNGNIIDEQRSSFGVRTFSFDPEKGFFLNGRHLKLMGTNRHQDFKDRANALPDEMHLRDVRLLKEMGGNFLRIAHYPQDPIVSAACDRLGIVTSVEIPIVDRIGSGDEFAENCVNMIKEMVYQSYNHPSMVIWAYMNEVIIDRPWRDGNIGKEEYFAKLRDCASRIDAAIRQADPSRPTMIPCHNAPALYKESGITEIPDILGFNLYCGWYTPGLDTFGPTLDKLHAMFPGKSLILSEYGADADARLHSFAPESFDYTIDYSLQYHKAYIPVIRAKDYLAGSNVWNINDFYSEVRGFAVPHVNCKGLTTLTREPKDMYWLYKATLSQEPFLRIGGHSWIIRGGQEAGGSCVQKVEVYSNASSVELSLNGQSLGSAAVSDNCAVFDVPFRAGWNQLEAKADNGCSDLLRVDFRLVPENMAEFEEINVMLGSSRHFEDREAGQAWIPEQEYRPGSWGYVGGEIMRPRLKNGTRPAFEANILGTSLDPVFQTQRAGLEAFKADVPDGKYYVYLYFAELTGSNDGKPLPYNLGNDVISSESAERVFDVSLNGTVVLKDFDIASEYGHNRAVVYKFTADVLGGKGLSVGFTPVKGLPVLNAIRIHRAE